MNVKLIDFGFSTKIPNERKIKIFCGTPSYMAPEIVEKKEYSGPPADMWALGVLLYALLCGAFPYKGATDEELYAKICRCRPRMPDHLSKEVIDFLSVIFTYDPDIRPSSTDIMKEHWLTHGVHSISETDSQSLMQSGFFVSKSSAAATPMTHKQRVAKLLGVKKVTQDAPMEKK